MLPRLQDAQHFVIYYLSAVDDFLSLQHYAFGADKPSVDFLLLLLAFLYSLVKKLLHLRLNLLEVILYRDVAVLDVEYT